MSYSIHEDFLKVEPSVIDRLQNPLDFLNQDHGCRTAARNSLNEAIARQHQDAQTLTSYQQHGANPEGHKRPIFTSLSHDIFNDVEDRHFDF